MNLIALDGYNAKIEYDAELDMFRGEILGLTGGADFSGKFNLRIPTELHEKLAIFAQAEGKSINSIAQEALFQRLAA